MNMETRTLGRTGLEVGVIGLGTEHLDTTQENMDEVLDLAVSAGVNYIDVLYNDPTDLHTDYWEAIGPALRRHRQRLVLTLHWGSIYHEPIDQCQQCFEHCLDRLGNGYADIAMPSLVDTEALWKGWAQDSLERLRGYQRDGRLGFVGISNHNVDVARMAVESGLIDVLMFPVNLYLHHGNQQRELLLETCAEHQVGVVAMKPYYGGRLLTSTGGPTGITPVQCLHYALSQPISTSVPGCRTAEHLRQALTYLGASDEERQFAPLHDELVDRLRGVCVQCRHCLPCPQEINIPGVIYQLEYVEFRGGGPVAHERTHRKWYDAYPAKGSDCIECEVCLERCPFDVDIIGKMRRAVEVFGS
jgi:predicted aldo/keto reductase-like oxidoreductase